MPPPQKVLSLHRQSAGSSLEEAVILCKLLFFPGMADRIIKSLSQEGTTCALTHSSPKANKEDALSLGFEQSISLSYIGREAPSMDTLKLFLVGGGDGGWWSEVWCCPMGRDSLILQTV